MNWDRWLARQQRRARVRKLDGWPLRNSVIDVGSCGLTRVLELKEDEEELLEIEAEMQLREQLSQLVAKRHIFPKMTALVQDEFVESEPSAEEVILDTFRECVSQRTESIMKGLERRLSSKTPFFKWSGRNSADRVLTLTPVWKLVCGVESPVPQFLDEIMEVMKLDPHDRGIEASVPQFREETA